MHKELAKFISKTSNFLLLVFVFSCKGFQAAQNVKSSDPFHYEGIGAGYVYLQNPVVNGESSPNYDENTFSRKITDEATLLEDCSFKQFNLNFEVETFIPCFGVYNEDNSIDTPLAKSSNTEDEEWKFEFETDQFYQVNAHYHVNTMMSRVLESMSFAHQSAFNRLFWIIPPAMKFDIASTKSFWLTKNAATETLKVISKCYLPEDDMNAFYDSSEGKLCFGYNENFPFRFIQDPSIIYHELGHVFVHILLNQRNVFTNGFAIEDIPFRTRLGKLSYDEGSALNEGIADYFTYYMTNRTKMGEWALGTGLIRAGFQSAIRPLTIDDDSHHAIFTSSEKLSYPRYLHYDSNVPNGQQNPDKESRQNAGQITSHYLSALHGNLKTYCSFNNNTSNLSSSEFAHKRSHDYIIYLLSETLAELGDLTSKGSDFWLGQNLSFTNLNLNNSFEWADSVNAVTYRKFYKTFAKNINSNISNYLCPEFDKARSEALLDQYGLLLFKKYADSGKGRDIAGNSDTQFSNENPSNLSGITTSLGAPLSDSSVDEINRNNSILISKDLIELPSENSGLNTAYLVDDRSSIENILSNLTFQGIPVATSNGLAGVEYNNNNIQIGPGEIIGISLNLINNSNSTMAGVQLLGNDWDHMKLVDNTKKYVNRFSNENSSIRNSNLAEHRPCRIQNFPLLSEGALEDSTNTQGDCSYNSKDNSSFDFEPTDTNQDYPMHSLDAPQPICLVQFSDENEQRWVSQNFYRKQLNLDDNSCLNHAISGSSFNPNACLVRVLPGASQSVYSKIDSNKTLAQTLTSDGSDFSLSSGNVILMEINKEIPPGTKFTCRFRARMSNCSDCYEDSSGEEYRDGDYTGADPFKVINFTFTVLE